MPPTQNFQDLLKGRVARKVEDLDDDTLQAITNASVPAAHATLDRLIEDWSP